MTGKTTSMTLIQKLRNTQVNAGTTIPNRKQTILDLVIKLNNFTE